MSIKFYPKKQHDYSSLTDEEIILLGKRNDSDAIDYIVNKYRNFVKAKARSYFLIGADREDLIQEGMIGLYKATRDFCCDRLVSFRSFADLCITRQMITAIKAATRQKHIPLNSYVSLYKPIYGLESEQTLLDIIAQERTSNPEELIISREELSDIVGKMAKLLSDLEIKVLLAYLDGKSYNEMASELGRNVKFVDNALQRIKRKTEKYLRARHKKEWREQA